MINIMSKTIFVLLMTIIFLIAYTIKSQAHSWYPPSCCDGKDCAPVMSSKLRDDGKLEITTEHGTAIVGDFIERMPSQDEKMHACLVPIDTGFSIRCFFVPPGG